MESTCADLAVDHVRNYSTNALTLCMIAKDYEDTRKFGDGQRIVRLLKFMLLFFKNAGKHKYAYHTLHHLAQIKFLLPPKLAHDVIWNRFVNNRGNVDSNVEMDRTVEHENRAFKQDCKGFMGKVSDKSITRSSCSYQHIEEVISNYDEISLVKNMSGKHCTPNTHEEVVELALDFNDIRIFGDIPGRCHKAFPSFPKTILQTIDPLTLKQWMIEKLNEFKDLSIYQKNCL